MCRSLRSFSYDSKARSWGVASGFVKTPFLGALFCVGLALGLGVNR